jgi:hypothetical protein
LKGEQIPAAVRWLGRRSRKARRLIERARPRGDEGSLSGLEHRCNRRDHPAVSRLSRLIAPWRKERLSVEVRGCQSIFDALTFTQRQPRRAGDGDELLTLSSHVYSPEIDLSTDSCVLVDMSLVDRCSDRMKTSNAGVVAAPLLIGLLSTLAGCAARPSPHEGAGLEWAQVAESHAALIALLYEGGKTGANGDAVAASAMQSVLTKLGPCATAQIAETSVRYTFTECKELPYGLSGLSGSVLARYEVSDFDQGGFVSMTLDGEGVSIGGATLDVKASAFNVLSRLDWENHTTSAEINHLSVEISSTGTSEEGRRITFDKIEGAFDGIDMVYADDARCADYDNAPPTLEEAAGTIENEGISWAVEVESFRHCRDRCPDAGGFVAVAGVLDGRLTNETPSFVRFDGSVVARQFNFFAGLDHSLDDRGKSGPVVLACVPAAK